MNRRKIRTKSGQIGFLTAGTMLAMLFLTIPVQAKDLLGADYVKSENIFQIKTDGLACYFCAYGLERFFRKTQKIYSMDISLKKGLVSIHFVKGKSIPPAKTIKGYIHDAGFTARTIRARLHGQFTSDGKHFLIQESGQKIPVLKVFKDVPKQKVIFIKARVMEGPNTFQLLDVQWDQQVQQS